MVTRTFGEAYGAPVLDPEAAAVFLRAWHGSIVVKDAGVRLFTLPARRGMTSDLDGLIEMIRTDGLDGLVYGGEHGEQQAYHVSSWVRGGLEPWQKGTDRDAVWAPGFWADLDVRSGGFGGTAEILTALGPIQPQIVVGSGSGGLHAYWRVHGGLSPDDAKAWGQRLRIWLEHETGYAVDAVAEPSRLLRLPGTVRFPKSDPDVPIDQQRAKAVTLLRMEQRFTDLRVVSDLTEAANAIVRERVDRLRTERRTQDARGAAALTTMMRESGDTSDWPGLLALAHSEEAFNTAVSWEEILEPAGWTRHGRRDHASRQMWTRPGAGNRNPRSLVTGWEESPNVASLLSLAPETGLSHLHEAGIPLTKARVWAELYHDGDLGRALWSWMRSLESETGL